MKHLLGFWWMYAGAIGGILYLRHVLKRRGGDEPMLRRIVLASSPRHDPKSPEYDPRLIGRQLLLVLVGLGLVGLVRLAIWFFSGG